MTDKELKAISTQLNNASPGPWIHNNEFGWIRDREDCLVVAGNGDQYGVYDQSNYIQGNNGTFIAHAPGNIRALLDDHERLQARITALKTIARVVAEDDIAYRDSRYEYEHCFWCPAGDRPGEYVSTVKDLKHAPECPVTQARALLASDTTEGAQCDGWHVDI